MHPVSEIDGLCVRIFMSIFGTVTDEKEMSVKARWLRKKYMGVWRWESSLMSRMVSRFPSTVVRYMTKNREEYLSWSSGWLGSSRRMNSDGMLWLFLLMQLIFSFSGTEHEIEMWKGSVHSYYATKPYHFEPIILFNSPKQAAFENTKKGWWAAQGTPIQHILDNQKSIVFGAHGGNLRSCNLEVRPSE